MNSFWSSLYDWGKDRRYAAIFFVMLIFFLGLATVGVVFCLRSNTLGFPLAYLLPAMCVLTATLVWIIIRFLRTQRRIFPIAPPCRVTNWLRPGQSC